MIFSINWIFPCFQFKKLVFESHTHFLGEFWNKEVGLKIEKLTIANLGNLSGAPNCAGPDLLFLHITSPKMSESGKFWFVDNFGVNLTRFSTEKLHIPLLNDPTGYRIQLLLNVYTIPTHGRAQNAYKQTA